MVDFEVFGSAKTFFSEWKDNRELYPIFSLLTIFFIIGLFWIVTNIKQFEYQANLFLAMMLFGLIVAGFDYFNEKNNLFGFLFIGKNLKDMAIAIIFGAFLAILLSINSFAVISTPLSSVTVSATVGVFLLSVLIAPYTEEYFFRMSLYPTIVASLQPKFGYFGAGVIAILIVSSAFALFHFAVFSAGISLMISAFIFSVLAIVGNRLFESSYFGFTLHIVNNFLVLGGLAFLAGVI